MLVNCLALPISQDLPKQHYLLLLLQAMINEVFSSLIPGICGHALALWQDLFLITVESNLIVGWKNLYLYYLLASQYMLIFLK